MTTLLIDTVATSEREKLRALLAQQEQVRQTIQDLRTVGMNDDFFSVACAELTEASNADRVLCGEIKIIESEITERITEARLKADGRLRGELRPMYLDLFKIVERARDVRRKIMDCVQRHIDQTGSTRVDAVPFAWLETLDEAQVWSRENGLL